MILNRDGNSIGADRMVEQLHSSLAFSADVEGVLLGCAGLMIPWPGVGLCWMILTKEASAYGLWLTRTTRRFLDDATRAYGLHRLEATALMDSDRNMDWLRLLGFTPEQDGTARAYFTDKRSIRRFERITEGD